LTDIPENKSFLNLSVVKTYFIVRKFVLTIIVLRLSSFNLRSLTIGKF
jgi:hypothetical protein